MCNRNDQSSTFGTPGLPVGKAEEVTSAQSEQEHMRAMFAAQQEAAAIQNAGVQSQIVHLLALTLRVIVRTEDIPTDEKASLVAKLLVAMNRHLSELPDENEKSGVAEIEQKSMGFSH